MIGVRCPKCRKVLVFAEASVGDVRRCPECKEVFTLRDPEDVPSVQTCPECGEQLPADAALCVKCGYGSRPGQKLALVEPGTLYTTPDAPTEKRPGCLRRIAVVFAVLLVLLAILVVLAAIWLIGVRDDAAFRTAEKQNTVAAYEQYVKDHPQGEHIDEARRRIEKRTSAPGAKAGGLKEVGKGRQGP